MTEEKIRELLDGGEGFTVEYKQCVNSLNNSVFETVASFSNRYGDADQDITKSVELVANLYRRKSATYYERKIFPYATTECLRMDLLDRVRRMAIAKRPDHPWKEMTDMELLRNAGLYENNMLTGEKGLNLAAILLLGKDEVIQSACPGYKTDAIYRDDHPDRYDDRLIVETNLIESYDQLTGFIAKHTNDKFFLIDNVNTSARDVIAREIVGNTLVHREYASAFPAKLIIDPEKITTENWNRSLYPGKLDPENFTPYPKNPILARFFVNIGRADALGSGVRNLYRYTKIYCGGEPELDEGDVFRAIVPLKRKGRTKKSAKSPAKSAKKSAKSPAETQDMTPRQKATLETMEPGKEYSPKEMEAASGLKASRAREILGELVRRNLVRAIGATRNRRYVRIEV